MQQYLWYLRQHYAAEANERTLCVGGGGGVDGHMVGCAVA